MSPFGLAGVGSVERRIHDLTHARFGVLIAVEIYRDRNSWHVRLLDDSDEIADSSGDTLTEALSKAEDALERWIDEREDEIAEGRAIEASESREVA